jgi:hypothetical protein
MMLSLFKIALTPIVEEAANPKEHKLVALALEGAGGPSAAHGKFFVVGVRPHHGNHSLGATNWHPC